MSETDRAGATATPSTTVTQAGTKAPLKPSGLRGRVLESLVALATSTVVGQGANTVATLLLAGILAPAEFGAISIATLIVTAATVARNAFVFQTLMHRADRVRESADQIVVLAITIGSALCLAAWLGAPQVAVFFHAPKSADVLRLIALAFLIDSIGAVPDTLFEKELQFRRKMWLEVAKPVVVAVVSVALAALGAGPIAVGWGQLSGFTVWTVGLYVRSDYRPRPRWDPRLMRELLGYGRYVLAGSLLVFFFTNLDNASVARLLGPRALGYYAFVFVLAYFPANVITGGVTASIALPVFSKLQAQREALGASVLATLRYVGLYAAPMCVGIMVLGPSVLHAAYGHKWVPAYTALQILSVYGLAHSYFLIIRNLCNGTGRARVFWRISGLQLVAILPLLVWAPATYGISGTAGLFTASKVVATLIALAYAVSYTRIPARGLLRIILMPLVLSALAAVVALLAGYVVTAVVGGKQWFTILIELTVFGVMYALACLAADPKLFAEVGGLLAKGAGRKGKREVAAPEAPSEPAWLYRPVSPSQPMWLYEPLADEIIIVIESEDAAGSDDLLLAQARVAGRSGYDDAAPGAEKLSDTDKKRAVLWAAAHGNRAAPGAPGNGNGSGGMLAEPGRANGNSTVPDEAASVNGNGRVHAGDVEREELADVDGDARALVADGHVDDGLGADDAKAWLTGNGAVAVAEHTTHASTSTSAPGRETSR